MNCIADLLRGIEQVLVIQMGVARGRLMVGVTEQPPDHRQSLFAHRGMAGEGMAQIVDAQLAKVGPFKDRPPEMLDAADRPAVLVIPEQPGNFRMARQTIDDLACRQPEPDCARPGLAVAQEQAIALHILPLEGENLTIRSGCAVITLLLLTGCRYREILADAKVGEHFSKPRQFLGG